MSKNSTTPKTESILAGVNGLIDGALGFGGGGVPPRYRRRFSCRDMRPLTQDGMTALLESILAKIGTNWDIEKKTPKSRQNWRFEKRNKPPSEKNKSREVLRERAIVSIAAEQWADVENWANQVPVASGLTGARRDKRRCIDLVRRSKDGEYEFVELKIESDTPLYAAIEVLIYGLLYIFWRSDPRLADFRALPNYPEMLRANTIHLIVAAPAAYFKKHSSEANHGECELTHFAQRMNAALIALLEKRQSDFKMDFKFSNLEESPFPSEVLYRNPS